MTLWIEAAPFIIWFNNGPALMARDWRLFEQAVAAFLQAHDPSATVRPNVYLPDRHHGRRRQRDIWIDAHICGFKVSLLVSCKKLARRLNALDLDHFHGELLSSRAQKGIIYSASGFNDEALVKARELNIDCCRLYENSPPDVPEALFFDSLLSLPSLRIGAPVLPQWAVGLTIADLVSLRAEGATRDLAEELAMAMDGGLMSLQEHVHTRTLPPPLAFSTSVGHKDQAIAIEVQISCTWKHFRGKLTAHRATGSYNASSTSFVGEMAGPPIDTQEPPGEGWEEISEAAAIKRSSLIWAVFRPGIEQSAACLRAMATPIKGTTPISPNAC